MRNGFEILSLNINGATSKIEGIAFRQLCINYDIVCLSELKCAYPFSLPGFKCIRSRIVPGEELRGGVAVMFKDCLWNEVYDVTTLRDQVWFKLRSSPTFSFAAVYITPRDSPYFSPESFANIYEHCAQSNLKYVILGDMNSRIPDLKQFTLVSMNVSYTENPDTALNAHGTDLIKLCKDCSMRPVNHCVYNDSVFDGGLTFKQKDRWISQLDWAIVSNTALPDIESFCIIKGIHLPTNHAPIAIKIKQTETLTEDLLSRARQLGVSYTAQEPSVRRPLSMQQIDQQMFQENLPSADNLWQEAGLGAEIGTRVADILYDTASTCSMAKRHHYTQTSMPHCQNAQDRWNNILRFGDSKQLWQAINWSGSFHVPSDCTETPNDMEFCRHFEKLLNPVVDHEDMYIPNESKYIPVLDDDISPLEVDNAIKLLKANKAAGIDEVPPGILKLVTDEWILLITFIFNEIFSGHYPPQWAIAKVFTIFKKGDKLNPENYRGISIIVALAKLYDSVLAARLNLWYKPKKEQAGSQKGRGCEEQILTVRLLIDIARKTKQPLYIAFVDYKKAYDNVNRYKLLKLLDKHGCGSKFLRAIGDSLWNSSGKIGSELFKTSAGVRQGGCTSCPLFTFFIEPTISAVKSLGPDGWLRDIHVLLLMDDTAVFATSRVQLEKKLRLLKTCTDDIGMVIHPTKSKYLSVNGKSTQPILVDGITLSYTESYMYLGTPIVNASVSQQVKQHIDGKTCHVMKFISFLAKNNDAPFLVKKRVWDSAFQAAIFYGSETWLAKDLCHAEKSYIMTLKQLLGVRGTTCNDISCTEIGVPTAKYHILSKQTVFLRKLTKREDYEGSYVEQIITMAMKVKSPMGQVLQTIMANVTDCGHDYKSMCVENTKVGIRNATSTRKQTYIQMNPTLEVSSVYDGSTQVPEYARIAFTRMRLSSHKLKIETGRWARLPREARLCTCGAIQTEEHVLLHCALTQSIRDTTPLVLNHTSVGQLLNDDKNCLEICKLCARILAKFS